MAGSYYVQFPTYRICVLCSPGYYSDNGNTSSCSACPLNTYFEGYGATLCNSCPKGYVSASVGSKSKSDCVNPVVNFSFGILSLLISFLAVFVYIILGRVQRIAFERRRWLIERSVAIYRIFLYMIEDVRQISRTVALVRAINQRAFDQRKFSQFVLKAKEMSNFILFLFLAAAEAISIELGGLIMATLQVLFNGMLLYRAYGNGNNGASLSSSNGNSLFFDRINEFLFGIGKLLNLELVIGAIIYPVIYVLQLLSFDLINVQVPCSGSQAPINLLLDCFVAAVVLISISSDANLFWTTRVKKAFGQWTSLLSNRSYLFGTLCSSKKDSLFAVVPLVVLLLPSPMKVNQYLISYVSVSEFFVSNGRSKSSSNCDAAGAIPMDTIVAFLTTILVVILVPPIIYLLGLVVFPSPMIIKEATTDVREPSQSILTEVDKWWRLFTAPSSIDWFFFKIIFDIGFFMVRRLNDFTISIGEKFGHENEMKKFAPIFEDPLKGAALPEVSWVHAIEYFEARDDDDTEWQTEEMKWKQQNSKFPTYYTIVQLISADGLNTSTCWKIPSERIRQAWGTFFKYMGCWIVPLQILHSTLARDFWVNVVQNYVKFFFMSVGYWTDHAVKQLSLIDNFRAFEASITSVLDDPEVVRTTENPLFNARSSIFADTSDTIVGNHDSFQQEDEEAKVEEDALLTGGDTQEMFVYYLSALTSCRSVMWQLIPGMTALAILSVDTSTCPIFVFSDQMRLYLPPFIATDAWRAAKSELQSTLMHRPKIWQIFLVACYLWMKNSRLVQFSHQIFVNIVTFYIVFATSSLYLPVCAFVGVELLMGLVTFGYYFVQLHRTFFDSYGEEK